MLILPYLVDSNGDIQFYLDSRFGRPKLFNQQTYFDGDKYTQLSNKVQLLLLNVPPSDKIATKINYYNLIKQKIKLLKSYQNLFKFIQDNNKIQLKKRLISFKEHIPEYHVQVLRYDKFSNSEIQTKNTNTNINIMQLPTNTNIYKAMAYTDKNITNDNPYSNRSAWFSTLEVAKKYAQQRNQLLKNQNVSPNSPMYWRVYSYKTVKPIKLIYLMDFNNLHTINNTIKNQLSKVLNASSADIKKSSNNQKELKPLDIGLMNNLISDINTIKALTGYELTYKQQLDYIKNIHKAFRRKISDPQMEILDSFYNHERGNRTRKVRYKIGSNYHSNLSYDLNRISMGTELDRSMLNTIKQLYSDTDGYVSYRVPSIWEYGRYGHNTSSRVIPTLDEEIGLFVQKGRIVRDKDNIHDNRIFM